MEVILLGRRPLPAAAARARALLDPRCATLKRVRLVPRPEEAGSRLDRFLCERVEGATRSLVAQWIRAGAVQVGGSVESKSARRVRADQSIDVEPAQRPPLRADPEAIDIEVLYEDGDLAVINKAPGMAVHAGAGSHTGTLVNALLHRFGSLSGASGPLRPGIVHRLDRFTSGVMVVAKHDRSHRQLQEQFQQRSVFKLYWAAVERPMGADPHDDPKLLRHGHPVKHGGAWWLRTQLPIRRDRRNRVKMAVALNGREARSDIRCLRSSAGHALAEVRIHTGRTHQVRVHLAALGHPVVGDSLYGARKELPDLRSPGRYLLHARALEFIHPASRERLRHEAPLPADFRAELERLGL